VRCIARGSTSKSYLAEDARCGQSQTQGRLRHVARPHPEEHGVWNINASHLLSHGGEKREDKREERYPESWVVLGGTPTRSSSVAQPRPRQTRPDSSATTREAGGLRAHTQGVHQRRLTRSGLRRRPGLHPIALLPSSLALQEKAGSAGHSPGPDQISPLLDWPAPSAVWSLYCVCRRNIAQANPPSARSTGRPPAAFLGRPDTASN